MSAPEFEFALRLYEDRRFDDVLRELTTLVADLAGCPAAEKPGLCDQVSEAMAQCRADRSECSVRFRAHGGEIEIVLSSGDRCVCRTSRRCS